MEIVQIWRRHQNGDVQHGKRARHWPLAHRRSRHFCRHGNQSRHSPPGRHLWHPASGNVVQSLQQVRIYKVSCRTGGYANRSGTGFNRRRGPWKSVWFTTWKTPSVDVKHFGASTKWWWPSSICTSARSSRPSSTRQLIRSDHIHKIAGIESKNILPTVWLSSSKRLLARQKWLAASARLATRGALQSAPRWLLIRRGWPPTLNELAATSIKLPK